MGFTTPSPELDVTAIFPGIDAYAATATRLHPVRAAVDPRSSHIGGPMPWPADEPWPTCAAEHVEPTEVPLAAATQDRLRAATRARDWPTYTATIAELAGELPGFAGVNRRTGTALAYLPREPRETALVPVAHLRTADVADLWPPDASEVLQVLWCPYEHDLDGVALGPAVSVRWRREADLSTMVDAPGRGAYVPRPCRLYPEQVVEYPWWQQLPPELGNAVRDWDAGHGGTYHRRLAIAPGWKVGGWPSWPTTDPMPMYCERDGSPLRPLLQIDSNEWGDPVRWRPRDAAAQAEPTGVYAGRSGLYRIFFCPCCPDAAIRVDLQ